MIRPPKWFRLRYPLFLLLLWVSVRWGFYHIQPWVLARWGTMKLVSHTTETLARGVAFHQLKIHRIHTPFSFRIFAVNLPALFQDEFPVRHLMGLDGGRSVNFQFRWDGVKKTIRPKRRLPIQIAVSIQGK